MVRDRASGTGVTVGIIAIDPTANSRARASVLDHLTMPDGDSERFPGGQLGYQSMMVKRSNRPSNVDDTRPPA